MAYTFDGPNKLIILTTGTTSMSIKDLWSRWVDWYLTSDNGKFLPAMEQVGGQVISITNQSYVPIYVTLVNGWKIRPQEANHNLDVTEGVLISDDNLSPFVATIGAFNIQVNYVQPIQAISIATSTTGTDLQDIYSQLITIQSALDKALTKTQYIALS
jgi:hypothetical protein